MTALAADHSPQTVARLLAAEGVPTTRQAGEWRASSVRRVLAGAALDAAAAHALARHATPERTA